MDKELARPESEPKTPLAARLRQLRKAVGNPDRDEVASKIGVGKSTLASYERGESEPSASALAAYKNTFGANVLWIISGEGEMFSDPSKAPAPRSEVDIVLLQQLHDTVQAVFIECKQSPPSRAVTAEAGELYNQMLGMVADIRDKAVVTALIPVLRSRFKERINNVEPGTGKRSAS